MSQLIRCTVRTPMRERCNCPVKLAEDGLRWVHAPELEDGRGELLADGRRSLAEVVEFHRVHIGEVFRAEAGYRDGVRQVFTCMHTPHVDVAVENFLQRGRKDRPSDVKLVMEGRWINRRREPLPERDKPTEEDVVEMALRSLEHNGIARSRVVLTITPEEDMT